MDLVTITIIASVVLIVGATIFFMLNRSWGSSRSTPSPTPPQHISSESLDKDEVRRLVHQGRKIEAIKLVREHTDKGLREAKNYVEALERSAALPEEIDPSADVSAIGNEVRALLLQGKKIEAIKRVREHTQWGLKEAKEYVDAFESSL
ncbi:MAG: hypothetical protein GFH27_549301n298 [Chloroflexi bacterium AL-W]|nr:hypothetical protein [Chloroflexi bacterium AL-N1]NOK68492.1 hypothetical protein [Chloroflexi bacterium AL-N10]NOK74138.1 hypothetical protein [Chloroflexi bacterium AL-N5]NOK83105.1 hypothetical protein [Chloroflexi bacterium AL-W]NOK90628.1 hypothetical protein [Chloroflexi bacterium AL-N15]